MFAEYGARVKITGMVGILDGTRGTIVSDVPLFGHAANWDIMTDDGQQITMHVEEFDVTLSPTETAYRLTTRWSVDECLEAMVNIVTIGAQDRTLECYQGALVFELLRLTFHAEAEIAAAMGDDYSATLADMLTPQTERRPYVPTSLTVNAPWLDKRHVHSAACSYLCPALDGPPADPDKYSHDEDWGADDDDDAEEAEYRAVCALLPNGWESGTCSEPDRDGGYWPQDDGYGSPVYRVED